MSGILFLISAPSGSGKSTLVDRLRSIVENLEFSVSYTTRPPRGSEQEAREYHFISREEFQGMIDAGEFLEYADVFGNYYGTARKSLTDAFAKGDREAVMNAASPTGPLVTPTSIVFYPDGTCSAATSRTSIG